MTTRPSETGGGSRDHDRAERTAAVVVVVVFSLVCGALLWFHEMWRDELQAWLLARDSVSLADLWRNSRYEGHPLLWHVLLMPLAHWGARPVAMQLLHWVVATAAASVVALRAPFSIVVRAALIFSYLPLYEYGAVSRNYALSILGIWLFCALLVGRRSALPAAAAGAVAALASPMGMLLVPAMAAALALSGSVRRRRTALALIIAAGALAAVQCVPPPDYEHARGWFLQWQGLRALYVLRGFAAALLPLPQASLHFWNGSALFPSPLAPPPTGSLGGIGGAAVVTTLVAATTWLVRRCRQGFALWGLGLAALVSFAYLKFPGTTRHAGFVWVLLVATLWLAVAGGRLHRRAAEALLAPSLIAGLIGSGVAALWEIREPFSGARCAARQLLETGQAELPLVGGNDWASSGVAAYLPSGRLFYPASRSEGSYIVWNLARTRQDALPPDEIVSEALARDRGEGVVLLFNMPLAAPQCRSLFVCAPTIVEDEGLWGYLCTAPPGRPSLGVATHD